MWAHQQAFTTRIAYRAVEMINWFFEHLNHQVPELEEFRRILLKEMFMEVVYITYYRNLGQTLVFLLIQLLLLQ